MYVEESLFTRSKRCRSIYISSHLTRYRLEVFFRSFRRQKKTNNVRLNLGNIYFNYVHIPQVTISDVNHAHRLGLSDAYMSQHITNEHIIRFITLYDKLNLEKEKIRNGVSIVFSMDNSK